MSLPGVFQTELASIPNRVPYLHVDAQRAREWSTIAGERSELRVGLVWRGDPRGMPGIGSDRFLPRAISRRLAGVPGVQFYSLQVGAVANETAGLAERLPLVDLAPRLHDFTDTAAALSRLDLLITSDTATAHLAGALGRRVWVGGTGIGRLALAARARGLPLVSNDAVVPST